MKRTLIYLLCLCVLLAVFLPAFTTYAEGSGDAWEDDSRQNDDEEDIISDTLYDEPEQDENALDEIEEEEEIIEEESSRAERGAEGGAVEMTCPVCGEPFEVNAEMLSGHEEINCPHCGELVALGEKNIEKKLIVDQVYCPACDEEIGLDEDTDGGCEVQ